MPRLQQGTATRRSWRLLCGTIATRDRFRAAASPCYVYRRRIEATHIMLYSALIHLFWFIPRRLRLLLLRQLQTSSSESLGLVRTVLHACALVGVSYEQSKADTRHGQNSKRWFKDSTESPIQGLLGFLQGVLTMARWRQVTYWLVRIHTCNEFIARSLMDLSVVVVPAYAPF